MSFGNKQTLLITLKTARTLRLYFFFRRWGWDLGPCTCQVNSHHEATPPVPELIRKVTIHSLVLGLIFLSFHLRRINSRYRTGLLQGPCWGLLTQAVCSDAINKLKAVAPCRDTGWGLEQLNCENPLQIWEGWAAESRAWAFCTHGGC